MLLPVELRHSARVLDAFPNLNRIPMEITQAGPFLIVEQERFVARFPADPADDLEQLENQDFYVTVTGGPTYYATLMTLSAIDAVLRRWAETGEAAGGRYFYTTDLVITPRPGITAMIEAINELVQEEEIGNACQIISGVIEQDLTAEMDGPERVSQP